MESQSREALFPLWGSTLLHLYLSVFQSCLCLPGDSRFKKKVFENMSCQPLTMNLESQRQVYRGHESAGEGN